MFSNNMIFTPQRQAPAINWLDSLKTAFYPLSLSEDNHVILHNLPYIVQMSHIVNNWLNRQDLKNRYSEAIETWRWWYFSIFLTLFVILLYLAILSTRSWSSIFCTPWCLPWILGFLKLPGIFPWLWVKLRRWDWLWEPGAVNWFVGSAFFIIGTFMF